MRYDPDPGALIPSSRPPWVLLCPDLCLGLLGRREKLTFPLESLDYMPRDSLFTVIKLSWASDSWKSGRQADNGCNWRMPLGRPSWCEPSISKSWRHPLDPSSASGERAFGGWWARCGLQTFASEIPHFLAWIDGRGMQGWHNGLITFIAFDPHLRLPGRGGGSPKLKGL